MARRACFWRVVSQGQSSKPYANQLSKLKMCHKNCYECLGLVGTCDLTVKMV